MAACDLNTSTQPSVRNSHRQLDGGVRASNWLDGGSQISRQLGEGVRISKRPE